MTPIPIANNRPDRAYLLAHGPNRCDYLAKFTDAEWWLWMGLGGVMPSRIRERFKVEIQQMRIRLKAAKREADEAA